MPQGNNGMRKLLLRFLFLSLAGCALTALERGRRRLTARPWDEWDEERIAAEPAVRESVSEPNEGGRPRARRLATTLVFSTLFFCGAALSAGAGDQMRGMLENGSDTVAVVTDEVTVEEPQTATEPAVPETPEAPPAAPPVEEPPAETPPADEPASGTEDVSPPSTPNGGDASVDAGTSDESAPRAGSDPSVAAEPNAPVATPRTAAATRSRAPRRPAPKPAPLDPEVKAAAASTIWINRALPDPTPPALRLTPKFARELAVTSKRAGVDWALVLAVLRARGALGSVPASPLTLAGVADRLAAFGGRKDVWGAALGFSGQMIFADRAAALTHYYRAVGLRALVTGVQGAAPALARRLLADQRVSMYAGGRDDVARGRVNVRVLILVQYLAETFGQVTVSSLISGHRLYSRPGVVSAHVYGHAVDISSLAGASIEGNQEPGSVTERAVRAILLLPPGMRPRQVISLLGLGGPSFPLADHHNHIHVGY